MTGLTKPWIGAAIAALSLAALFWTGIRFDLFGQRIDFRAEPALALFFGSLCSALFGVLLIFLSIGWAARLAVCVFGLYLLLFIAGRCARGEL